MPPVFEPHPLPSPLAGSRPIRSLPPEYRGREQETNMRSPCGNSARARFCVDTARTGGYRRRIAVIRRILHFLLCGMAVVQLGAVPPCLLDESAEAVLAEADGDAIRPNSEQPRVWHNEDQDDPQFAAIRAGAIEAQTSLPAASRDVIPYLAASFHTAHFLPAMPVCLSAHRFYDAGPPPDGLAALSLPLLI